MVVPSAAQKGRPWLGKAEHKMGKQVGINDDRAGQGLRMGRRREQIKRGLMDQMQDLGHYPRDLPG